MVLVSVSVGPRVVYDSDVVCEPEIPTHIEILLEKLNLVEQENKYLKEKLKIIEDKNMELELHVADVIDDRKMKIDAMLLKMDAMRLMIRNIRKYVIDKEAWYHYVVGSIVTLVAILIDLLLHLNVLHSCVLFYERTLCIYFYNNNV
uniref:Uncharacterized protein n=1 Tax=Hordeum vulgare subsp. vulgare TaxID=112509 RepID=A0A8I7BG86_HORVV